MYEISTTFGAACFCVIGRASRAGAQYLSCNVLSLESLGKRASKTDDSSREFD